MKHSYTFDMNRKPTSIPPQVQDLAPRERQIALTIYVDGPMTAKQLEQRLSMELKNASIRSMLNRLCEKGVLEKKKQMAAGKSKGRHSTYVYFPAILPASVQEAALRQLARDFFDGSLLTVAQTAIELVTSNSSETYSDAGARRSRRDNSPASQLSNAA